MAGKTEVFISIGCATFLGVVLASLVSFPKQEHDVAKLPQRTVKTYRVQDAMDSDRYLIVYEWDDYFGRSCTALGGTNRHADGQAIDCDNKP